MKIAILGASHWHVRLMYLDALRNLGHEVVAIADRTQEKVDLLADKYEGPRLTNYEQVLTEYKPDFVFAHAPHCDMTDLAQWLVLHHQPFHMEKPMGVDWRALAPVATQAETEKVFASVALVSRYYAIAQWLKAHQSEIGRVNHYYYRLFAGDPGRYRDWGVEWMLDPQQAGAGPLFNFGPHVIDLFLYLCTERVVRVNAAWSHGLHGEEIEDLASVTMIGESGQIGVGEISYTKPTGYERYFSVDSEKISCGAEAMGNMEVQWRDGRKEQVVGNDFDDVYGAYTKDTLERFAAGQQPVATIADMVKALRIMCAARQSAQAGRAVRIGGADEDDVCEG